MVLALVAFSYRQFTEDTSGTTFYVLIKPRCVTSISLIVVFTGGAYLADKKRTP